MALNVNRNLTDQFYRYKMPRLVAKVEGKGNGIKTVIVNMVEIAKALNRPPMYPTKYFGCVLGAQVNCDAKNERYIVNGSHDSAKLQDLLDGFIKKYVLCGSCENPETTLVVNQKKGTINALCKACGFSGTINLKDKLSTYILKCPPDQPTAPGASVSKKNKKKVKDGKKGETNGRASPHDSDEMNDTGVNGDEVDDDDWCDNPEQLEDSTGALQKLTLNSDLEKSQEDRLQMFFDFTKPKTESDSVEIEVQKEIVTEAERLDIKDKAVIVLCELLFNDPQKIFTTIKNNRLFFARFTADNTKAQKYFIRGLEQTIKKFPTELVSRVAMLLKLCYDLDLLDEKVILDWSAKKKPAGKQLSMQIHQNAQPFIKWLQEAEEEESDEEDDDVEVVYDERSRPDKIIEIKEVQTVAKPNATVAATVGKEDEIDIDAI